MKRERMNLRIRGIVQGVGFRPFLHRLAEKYGLSGWVRNTSGGVETELEGRREDLEGFIKEVKESPPPLASVEETEAVFFPSLKGYQSFWIERSLRKEEATLIPPDSSLCPDCERELLNPEDRRYRYPFINCTNCGPRYTIIRSLPYDRRETSMAGFSMCRSCSREYGDIRDRRYHAQPDCCPECGPKVFYETGRCGMETDERDDSDPIRQARQTLAGGGIVAVKGIGGIHLACDAENEEAVKRLRERKKRPEKPMAVMTSIEEAERLCRITEGERKLLKSPRRPIVLLKKRDRSSLSWVSAGPRLGVMLPYSPLHLLLLGGGSETPGVLVMTSANCSGCPVLTDETEAKRVLKDIADGFLLHNRPIENRCDDSLVMEWENGPYFFRRSRGYAPQPISGSRDMTGLCAFGAEQKASFAMGRGHHIFLSPYIGDLKNMETIGHYQTAFETYRRLFRIKPQSLICDLHPDYASTRAAEQMAAREGIHLLQVQHHWAHMASCMADNGLEETVFGIIWDGTGMGTDGTIWGGEFLEGDLTEFRRLGSIRPVSLAGGDRAVQEIGRIALALLKDADCPGAAAPLEPKKAKAVEALLSSGVSCPQASSVGRLFDGICALILRKTEITYSGEGGALLEAVSLREEPEFSFNKRTKNGETGYPVEFYMDEGLRRFDTRPLIRAIAGDWENGVPPEEIASRFMEALCIMAAEQCRELNRKGLPVVLSGGVFQNRFLLSGITALLKGMGYRVYCHKRVAAGDEGLCLGQLAIGERKLREEI